MGLFDVFRPKKNGDDPEAMLIGYLRIQTSKHLGLNVNSREFLKAQESAAKIIEGPFILLLNKVAQQTVVETISSACPKRYTETYGEYLVLLFTRFGIIQHAIKAGKVKPEEATLDIVNSALHDQVKGFIRQTILRA